MPVLRKFHDCHNVLLRCPGTQAYKIRDEICIAPSYLGDNLRTPFHFRFGLQLNVLFTLLASLIIIYLINRMGWLVGIATLALFFPLSLICDWSIIAPVFTIIYYVLQKRQKENLSILLLPASYIILRMILYTETRIEYITGTISVFLATLLVFIFSKKAEMEGKGRIPGLVFYAYYPLHLTVIWLLLKCTANCSN